MFCVFFLSLDIQCHNLKLETITLKIKKNPKKKNWVIVKSLDDISSPAKIPSLYIFIRIPSLNPHF